MWEITRKGVGIARNSTWSTVSRLSECFLASSFHHHAHFHTLTQVSYWIENRIHKQVQTISPVALILFMNESLWVQTTVTFQSAPVKYNSMCKSYKCECWVVDLLHKAASYMVLLLFCAHAQKISVGVWQRQVCAWTVVTVRCEVMWRFPTGYIQMTDATAESSNGHR